MSSTYISLLISVIAGLLYKNNKALFGAIIATNLIGLYSGIINLTGALSIGVLAALTFLHSRPATKNKILKTALFIGVITVTAGLAFHAIPGFFNTLIADKIQISDLSCPFSMYLNFDKVMAALIIYSMTNLHEVECQTSARISKQNIILILLSIITITAIAYSIGYIKLNPKLPDILPIWAINNLFFVCFAEEVMFRGFIQRKIGTALSQYKRIPHLNIIITSLLFGAIHLKGGIEYVALASVASFCYGYIYYKTNRILWSMFAHFGVNLCHIILFTYPAPVGMC